jgi:hypothetical protein
MKLRIFRKLILFAVFFGLGFLTHALFFPDVLANGFTDVASIVIPIPTPTQAAGGQQYSFQTTITYDGAHFSRHNIAIASGNYLAIKNIAKQNLMTLVSNDPNLATGRGYGEAEQVKERMDTAGQYVVEDKTNPQEKIVITVK